MSKFFREPDGRSGFGLLEALVALAVVAIVLASIGSLVAGSVRGVRFIDGNLSSLGAMRRVLSNFEHRDAVRIGHWSGVDQGQRWEVDVRPLTQPLARRLAADDKKARWRPVVLTVRLFGQRGSSREIEEVRLIPVEAP